ncbi:hypothetical protein JOB18_017826 [Solea senegalensis]|uniref:Uncharacterized protein n=1 Tax=Solea senegalensis TaxID=28829 RepID=A0AAV6RI66_SOLSE|nr:hypothetical protein JOB18_017826 [Solea senegalensis]
MCPLSFTASPCCNTDPRWHLLRLVVQQRNHFTGFVNHGAGLRVVIAVQSGSAHPSHSSTAQSQTHSSRQALQE